MSNTDPRKPGLNRLVVSGGKSVKPRLYLSDPDPADMTRRRRIGELLACAVIGFIIVVIFVALR